MMYVVWLHTCVEHDGCAVLSVFSLYVTCSMCFHVNEEHRIQACGLGCMAYMKHSRMYVCGCCVRCVVCTVYVEYVFSFKKIYSSMYGIFPVYVSL